MIFTHLTLHNYSAFRGRQTLALVPEDRARPVVLIGALNGSGKTSLLDAFQLALYGKRARTSNRGDLAWDDYLRQCVHTGSEHEGAALELGLRHRRDGKDREVVVRRQWKDVGATVRETVEVILDGRRVPGGAESWDDEIENILPIGIASLFLFDAEKLEQLADLQQAQAILATAIEGLLGLELVSQLDLDLRALPTHLATLQRKQGPKASDVHAGHWARAERLEAEVELLAKACDKAMQAQAAAQIMLDTARRAFVAADGVWAQAGGTAHVQKAALERKQARLTHERDSANARLRDLMADALPFSLVQAQLRSVLAAAQREELANRQAVVVAEIGQRDRELLALARQLALPEPAVAQIAHHLAADLDQRAALAQTDVRMGMSAAGQAQIQALLGGGIDKQVEESQALQARLATVERELEDTARELAKVPADGAIAELAKRRDAALHAQAVAEQLIQTRCEALGASHAQRDAAAATLAALLTELIEMDGAASRERLLLAQAQEIRGQLQQFRKVAVERHTRRIAAAVLECFQSLIRKASLLDALVIDPQTYAVTLYDGRGRELPPKRLSAGERQLLATSLLWGLSRVSGRALPTVIDTPLGRMDSHHRRNLVERYFPHASHQVILLSTDEEINGGWLAELEPAIGRRFLLEHDDAARRTTVRDGYFQAAVA